MSNWLMLFGATQGLLTHLRFHNLTIQQTWATTTFQRTTLLGGLIGGAVIGFQIGQYFYGDAQLRRLRAQH
jgi:hypothetical protein